MQSLGEPLVKSKRVELFNTKSSSFHPNPKLRSGKRHKERLQMFRDRETNRVYFRYTWEMETVCEFSMLSEVSAHFQSVFARAIESLGMKLEHYEDDESVYEKLVVQ